MNITELARNLKVTTQELRDTLPRLGFDIGRRAIKIDERVAEQIIKKWAEAKSGAFSASQNEAAAAAGQAATVLAGGQAAAAEAPAVPEPPKVPPISIPQVITVRALAEKMRLPITRVISELMKNGVLASLNERVDYETAAIIAEDLGFAPERAKEEHKEDFRAISFEEKLKALTEDAPEKKKPRPPVVVVMGHVDHGKTKLLDSIRSTDVAAGEAGGITQHIGAYQVTVRPKGEPSFRAVTEPRQGIPSKKSTGSFGPAGAGPQDDNSQKRIITFIDTPGHEAFTVMRSRGARVADVAVLVVAADDGVQPQTIEVWKIIQAAKLPFVVALNKIDKADANPDKVKSQLSEIGLLAEEWGGKATIVPISAKTKQGIDELLETILLVADLDKEKISANPDHSALGTVIESHVDPGEGPVATILIQSGTLRVNDSLAVGETLYGRVRAMKDYRGVKITAALPGTPVRVLGFKAAPSVGDIIEVVEAKAAKKFSRVKPSFAISQVSAPLSMPSQAEKDKKVLPVIIKADVLGSLEAIVGALEKFIHPEVAVKVIGKGLGNITDAEILSGETAHAVVYGFHVQALSEVVELARDKGVKVGLYSIIYKLLDDIKDELAKLLPPEKLRAIFGKAKVLAIFRTERDSVIVGAAVIEGKAVSDSRVKIWRGDNLIGEGALIELQSGKRAVNEVFTGQECGIKIKGKGLSPLPGDILEIFREDVKKRELIF